MKLKMCFAIFLLLFSVPAFGELSTADLEKIGAMIKESENRMKESEAHTRVLIKESETRMKEYVGQEIAKVNIKVEALDKRIDDTNKRMTEGFANLDARLGEHFLLFMALVGFVAAVVGIPQIILTLQRRHQRVQDEKIEAQQQQIETQQQQIETLQTELELLKQ